MTNTKSTKRALLASVMAMLLCFSMLLGTTFAWFTDSVTSGNNIIKSGNLDIELEYWNGTNWADVKGASDILTNTLWEPGVTEVAYLRIANAGSLVLKYQFGVNILKEIEGKNQKNETFKLSDYIMFGVVEEVNGETDAYAKTDAGRAEAIADVTDAKKISAGYTKASTMKPDEELYLALVVYMPTDVNDVANHNGTDIPQIDLGINVFATQVEAELDSFGPDYDKDASAFVSSADELREAIANVKDGGTVYVNDGTYNINSKLTIPGKSVNIVGVGENAVIHMTDTRVNYNKIFYIYGSADGEDVTVNISNVTLTADIATKSDIWIRTDGPNGEKVNGNVTVNLDNVTCASIICDNNYVDGDTVNLNITNSNVKKVALDASPFNGNGLSTYTNLTYNASRIDSITINPAVNDLTHIKINGVNPTAHGEQQTLTYISTAEELAALGGTKINGNYALMANIDMSKTAMKPMEISGGANVVFNGNGYTISNLTLNAANIHGMTGAGNEVVGLFDLTAPATTVSLTVSDLIFENATVACNGYAGVVAGYNSNGSSTITLDNVDVKGATITAETVAGLVGYSTGVVNMTDCDVSGLALTGEAGRPEKVGALIGTANTATCTVAVSNCTNATAYNYAGRVINGASMTVDGMAYVTSANALAEVVANGATNILLADGEYDIKNCGGKTLTINGSRNAVIKIMNEGEDGCDYGFDGATVTFNGVTFDTTANTGNYKGYARMTATFNDCAFFGAYTTHLVQTFNDCTFDFNNGYLWIWGATEVSFNDCKFGGNSKAILAHGGANTVITINNCDFVATEKGYTGSGDNTAAVEIDPTGTNTYTITFTGENTKTDSYSGWTRVKDGSTGHTVTGLN